MSQFKTLGEMRIFLESSIKSKTNNYSYDALLSDSTKFEDGNQIDYLETSILIKVMFCQSGIEASRELKRLKKACKVAGDIDRFNDFYDKCNEILLPQVLKAHGFGLPILPSDYETISEGILEIVQTVNDLGHEIFINSGTLLGIVRDGAYIPYDDDIDFGLILRSKDVESAAEEWVGIKDKLIKHGIYKRSGISGMLYKTNHIGRFTVDIFPAWIIENSVYVYPHTFGELTRSDLLPLKKAGKFGLPIPNNPEKMLKVNYGKRWKIPDPIFSFPWKSQNKKFTNFIDAVKAKA